jgi:hypothetical protein
LFLRGRRRGVASRSGRNDEGRRDDTAAPNGGKEKPTTGVSVLPSASFLSLVAVVVFQEAGLRVRCLTSVEKEAERHGPEVEPSGPRVEFRAVECPAVECPAVECRTVEFRASAAAQGAPRGEAVSPLQAQSVLPDGAEPEADAPEPAPALVFPLTGQAAWAGAGDEAARACLVGSWAGAAPEAGLPGPGWELVSAGSGATGLGVRPMAQELCRRDVPGPAVERADWQPAAAGRTLTADQGEVRAVDQGEGLARSALPAGQSASS